MTYTVLDYHTVTLAMSTVHSPQQSTVHKIPNGSFVAEPLKKKGRGSENLTASVKKKSELPFLKPVIFSGVFWNFFFQRHQETKFRKRT